MILKTGTFSGMAQDIINSDSKIVIFGMGVIGTTTTPEILSAYNLGDRIICCVDNDRTRWKTKIKISGKEIEILSPNILKKLNNNITVLITASRYRSIFEQLNNMEGTDNYSCYIIPALCVRNFHNKGGKGVIKTSEKQLIPKRIHYMWLGGTEIPEPLQRCIDSWRRFCPDYEIIQWDESNYDVHKNLFVSQAYDNHMYGFVPDYARLELLYEYGGIYMDTDVELKRNIDELLYQEAFSSVEKWQILNFGGCSGAVKGHASLKPFLDNWAKHTLVRVDGTLNSVSSGLIDTTVALNAGYKVNGKVQEIMGMNVYSYDYFHPYDYMSGKLEMTDDTFSVHQFHGGWLDKTVKADSLEAARMYDTFMGTALDVG